MVEPTLVVRKNSHFTDVDRVRGLQSYSERGESWKGVGIMFVVRNAKFQVGQVVRHKVYPFRGVIFDVDPSFSNTEEWYRSIPQEVRPPKDQPFYHLLAENADSEYIAYVSEQNLVPDRSDEPLRHPQVPELFDDLKDGIFRYRYFQEH